MVERIEHPIVKEPSIGERPICVDYQNPPMASSPIIEKDFITCIK
jgi:hypothetical protein